MYSPLLKASGCALALTMVFVSCNSGRQTRVAEKGLRRPASTANPALDPYVQLLEKPELAWSHRDDDGKDLVPPTASEAQLAQMKGELEKMLQQYAPRVWWHKEEPYGPMDPITFVKDSSLWLRKQFSFNQMLSPKGQFKASQLGVRQPDSPFKFADLTPSRAFPLTRPYDSEYIWDDGYYLKYEGKAQTAGEILAEAGGQTPPMFWRINTGPVARKFAESTLDAARIVVEYWYHVPFSYATYLGIGNHQGDWEGVAMMIDLKTDVQGRLKHDLRAAYYAAHEGGAWHCADELTWTGAEKTGRTLASFEPGTAPDRGHPEAYTALGTHATYFAEGDFSTPFITDRTQRGYAWDTWQSLRPMELEPYYGYSGAWGDVGWFAFMTGPLAPGPTFKSLPKSGIAEEPSRCLATLER